MRTYSVPSSVLCAKHVRMNCFFRLSQASQLIQFIRNLLKWTIFFGICYLMLTNDLSISMTYHVTHPINPEGPALLHYSGTQGLSISRLHLPLCSSFCEWTDGEREKGSQEVFNGVFLEVAQITSAHFLFARIQSYGHI